MTQITTCMLKNPRLLGNVGRLVKVQKNAQSKIRLVVVVDLI